MASTFKYIGDDFPDNMVPVSGMIGLPGGVGGFLLPIRFGVLLDLSAIYSSCFMLLCGVVWVSLILAYITEVRRARVIGEGAAVAPPADRAAAVAISTRPWRHRLASVIVVISVVAGRIVPCLTPNRLAKRRGFDLRVGHGAIDRISLGALHGGLIGWAFARNSRPICLILLLGAALNLWRLLRCRGHETAAEPLLPVLHIGYAWLVLGAASLGLAALGTDLPLSAAIHAVTAGAIVTMILAVITSTARSHTGRDRSADRLTAAIYVFIPLAAITRVVAAFGEAWTIPLLITSAGLWIAAFAGFILGYGPMLILPRGHR